MKFHNKILAILSGDMFEKLGVSPEDVDRIKVMFVWEHDGVSENGIFTRKDTQNLWKNTFWKRHGIYPNSVTIYRIPIGDYTYEIDISESDMIPITTKLKEGVIVGKAPDISRIVEGYLEKYQE